jgi:hypothetical protein
MIPFKREFSSLFACSFYLLLGLKLVFAADGLVVSDENRSSKMNISSSLVVNEPQYCDPAKFDDYEVSLGNFDDLVKEGLVRVHAFHLGKVTLVGAGVGNSKATALIQLAQKYALSSATLTDRKYCTWYLNHPSQVPDPLRDAAVKSFHQKDIYKNPIEMTEDEAVSEFTRVIGSVIDQSPSSFLGCLQDQHYLAMGCNEMMHRGPTVFGMLLAFSGCTPEHSLEIVNQAWALNGVKRKVRLAVIRKAYALGAEHQESRKKFSELLSNP